MSVQRLHGWLRRAREAEAMRDELGRRADLLEAANRCARALGSSLDLDQVVGAFTRELRGLVPFDRMAIVLAEDGNARVLATAGEQADEVMPPGTLLTLDDNVLADVVAGGQTLVRADLDQPEYAEERSTWEPARSASSRLHDASATPSSITRSS